MNSSLEDALSNGDVSTGHLDAIVNATSRLDDTAKAESNTHAKTLLDDAKQSSVETFERNCRDLARAIVADRDGAELRKQQRHDQAAASTHDRGAATAADRSVTILTTTTTSPGSMAPLTRADALEAGGGRPPLWGRPPATDPVWAASVTNGDLGGQSPTYVTLAAQTLLCDVGRPEREAEPVAAAARTAFQSATDETRVRLEPDC